MTDENIPLSDPYAPAIDPALAAYTALREECRVALAEVRAEILALIHAQHAPIR